MYEKLYARLIGKPNVKMSLCSKIRNTMFRSNMFVANFL